MALVMDRTGVSWLAWAVKLGALAGLTTAILVLLYGQTRIFFAMAHDGLLPPIFARLHPEWRTPAVSQILVGVVVALAAGLLPLDILGEMVSIGTLAAFALVCLAVMQACAKCIRKSGVRSVRPAFLGCRSRGFCPASR